MQLHEGLSRPPSVCCFHSPWYELLAAGTLAVGARELVLARVAQESTSTGSYTFLVNPAVGRCKALKWALFPHWMGSPIIAIGCWGINSVGVHGRWYWGMRIRLMHRPAPASMHFPVNSAAG